MEANKEVRIGHLAATFSIRVYHPPDSRFFQIGVLLPPGPRYIGALGPKQLDTVLLPRSYRLVASKVAPGIEADSSLQEWPEKFSFLVYTSVAHEEKRGKSSLISYLGLQEDTVFNTTESQDWEI